MDDFFRKSFCEGGITVKQFNALFDELQGIEYDKFKLDGRLHGVEFKDDKSGNSKNSNFSDAHVDPEVPLFKDPSDYDSMTEDEKNSMTQKMMGKHKSFVKQKGL